MKKTGPHAIRFLLFIFLIMLLPVYAWPQDRGKTIYDAWCSQCHGIKGDGKGYAADFVFPKPRDFTRGTYKYKTTPTGYPTTDADIARIIRNGNPGTTMPAWKRFSDADVNALVRYIKKFGVSP
ncbi:MAG: cytochrome c [Nitrospiraceae bacterium]|nr:cytochrome c [Nitrospiraceae bacterium]